MRKKNYGEDMVATGDGELGFDSGGGACETTTTSKEGTLCFTYDKHFWKPTWLKVDLSKC